MSVCSVRAAATCAALALLLAGCAADPEAEQPGAEPSSEAPSSATPTPPPDAESSTPAPVATKRLDSIAVIGHSGATGTASDPDDPSRDATENSWATGENPEVQSVYHRLLATHPALEGHSYNAAINASRADDLSFQIDELVEEIEVVPDLVLIQTLENDMRCDGTDADNFAAFGTTYDQALTQIETDLPGARSFIVSVWDDVQGWAEWGLDVPGQPEAYGGDGPCDVFDEKGRLRPEGIASMQAIVDGYWAEIEEACARHPRCSTDGGAQLRQFETTDADVAMDHNHLSIAGHAKFAEIAWNALPEAIKNAR